MLKLARVGPADVVSARQLCRRQLRFRKAAWPVCICGAAFPRLLPKHLGATTGVRPRLRRRQHCASGSAAAGCQTRRRHRGVLSGGCQQAHRHPHAQWFSLASAMFTLMGGLSYPRPCAPPSPCSWTRSLHLQRSVQLKQLAPHIAHPSCAVMRQVPTCLMPLLLPCTCQPAETVRCCSPSPQRCGAGPGLSPCISPWRVGTGH